jgi:hypothetical protein
MLSSTPKNYGALAQVHVPCREAGGLYGRPLTLITPWPAIPT